MAKQEQIHIPKQRSGSRTREEQQQRIMSEAEVYAAQAHHHDVDLNADEILAEIDDVLQENGGGEDDQSVIEAVEIRYAAGSLAVAAAA